MSSNPSRHDRKPATNCLSYGISRLIDTFSTEKGCLLFSTSRSLYTFHLELRLSHPQSVIPISRVLLYQPLLTLETETVGLGPRNGLVHSFLAKASASALATEGPYIAKGTDFLSTFPKPASALSLMSQGHAKLPKY